MKGYLLDENLPGTLRFTPSLPIQHVRDLGEGITDSQVWEHAYRNELIIVTKDADFSDRMLLADPPPRVVHLRFGNMRLGEFHEYLESVWSRVEALLDTHKLVHVFLDRIEAVA